MVQLKTVFKKKKKRKRERIKERNISQYVFYLRVYMYYVKYLVKREMDIVKERPI